MKKNGGGGGDRTGSRSCRALWPSEALAFTLSEMEAGVGGVRGGVDHERSVNSPTRGCQMGSTWRDK